MKRKLGKETAITVHVCLPVCRPCAAYGRMAISSCGCPDVAQQLLALALLTTSGMAPLPDLLRSTTLTTAATFLLLGNTSKLAKHSCQLCTVNVSQACYRCCVVCNCCTCTAASCAWLLAVTALLPTVAACWPSMQVAAICC